MNTATFDFASEEWAFSTDGDSELKVRFRDADSPEMYPSGLRFGWTAEHGGQMVEDAEFPPANTTYVTLSAAATFYGRVACRPDDVVTWSVWAENAGKRTEATTTFAVPRPAKPYESWVWDDEDRVWTAPVPQPDAFYEWDESAGGWVYSGPPIADVVEL